MTKKNNYNVLVGLIAVIIVLLLLEAFGFGSVFAVFNWIFTVLLIILIITGIYWLIRHITIIEEENKMVKLSKENQMKAARARAAKSPGGKGPVKNRPAGKKIMRT